MDEQTALKSTIDRLQIVYFILFFTSIALIAARWSVQLPPIASYAWAAALIGAVITRLYRTSLVNKYNAMLSGGAPGPIQ